MAKKKLRIIIDSDTANEIDDAFALAYACVCTDIFDIKAVTIAPFSVDYKRINIKDGLVESKLEANRILRLAGFRDPNLVYKGADDFFAAKQEKNDAVNKIIEEAKKGKLTVVGLGVLTNIALALKFCPSIAQNLHVVWLGTRHLFYDSFDDTNYRRDKQAFEYVLKSDAEVTIIPSYVGKFIQTSESNMKRVVAVNDLGNYLYKIMKNSQFSKPSMGVRTIYDIAPIGYLVNSEWYFKKQVPANELLKDFEKTSKARIVNYIFDMKPNSVVWIDFVSRLSNLGNTVSKPKYFFISDTHAGDGKKYRLEQTGFKTIEEQDAEFVKRWNSVVTDKDIVYHLGDFGDYNFVKKLNGNIILICGNHEKQQIAKKGESFEDFKRRLIKLGFKDVKKNGIWLDEKVFGRPVFMTHKPSSCKKNAINLYGHIHTLKPIMKNGINVAWIYHDYAPMNEKAVKKGIDFLLSQYVDNEVFK